MMQNTMETVLIGLAIIAFVTYRLSQWQSVSLGKLFRMPLIFLLLAALSIGGSLHQLAGVHLGALDVVILGGELAAGVMVGWIIGRLTEIRTFTDGTRSRLTGPGIAVFLVFVAIRIGLGVLAASLGATVAALPAMALLVLAVIKTIQALMVRERVQQHQRTTAEVRSYAQAGR